ncbi:hypothetical protein [Methylobacterium sp. D54C]
MPMERHCVGDATGARSGSLAKIAVYYTAHLARRAKPPSSSVGTSLCQLLPLFMTRRMMNRSCSSLKANIKPYGAILHCQVEPALMPLDPFAVTMPTTGDAIGTIQSYRLSRSSLAFGATIIGQRFGFHRNVLEALFRSLATNAKI